VADLDDTAESGQSLLVDLFVGEKFRVIEKIPQDQPSFHIAFWVQ